MAGVGNLRLFESSIAAPFGDKQRPFSGIIFEITEVIRPDDSFAAFGEFHIVTNGL